MPYAYVNSGINNGASNQITYNPAAGNLAVLLSLTSVGAGSPTLTGVQDNNSVAWTQGIATYSFDSGSAYLTAYYKANCEAGITTITGTYNGGSPGGITLIVIEYSGIATSSPLINTVSNSQTGPGTGANALTSGTISVPTVPALCLGMVVDDVGGNPISAGTSPNAFTSRFTTTTGNDIILQDFRLTTGSAVGSTATASQGAASFGSMFLAFAESGGGGNTASIAWVK
jgi:hypothetical protein